MPKRDYERLPIEAFGRHLIETGDLDPIYIALTRIDWPNEEQLDRWLIAYWCFYHGGAACYLSEHEGVAFWEKLLLAARNEEKTPTGERWPRGHERRHFRGKAATEAVRTMHGRFFDKPERLVRNLLPPTTDDGTSLPFGLISARVQTLPLFGPWIGFKVADMVDRVLGHKVDFSEGDVFCDMFKDPTEAALRLWRLKAGFPHRSKAELKKGMRQVMPKDKKRAVHDVVNYLIAEFSELQAPPWNDRAIGVQEVETVLCKWKSHMNGHYPLYNDIDEIRDGAAPWTKVSETALLFMDAMPPHTGLSTAPRAT